MGFTNENVKEEMSAKEHAIQFVSDLTEDDAIIVAIVKADKGIKSFLHGDARDIALAHTTVLGDILSKSMKR